MWRFGIAAILLLVLVVAVADMFFGGLGSGSVWVRICRSPGIPAVSPDPMLPSRDRASPHSDPSNATPSRHHVTSVTEVDPSAASANSGYAPAPVSVAPAAKARPPVIKQAAKLEIRRAGVDMP